MNIGVRVSAGITTGALAVLLAQPTDVVKIRMQAGNNGRSSVRYTSTLQAYKNIASVEGTKGLWKGETTSSCALFRKFKNYFSPVEIILNKHANVCKIQKKVYYSIFN